MCVCPKCGGPQPVPATLAWLAGSLLGLIVSWGVVSFVYSLLGG